MRTPFTSVHGDAAFCSGGKRTSEQSGSATGAASFHCSVSAISAVACSLAHTSHTYPSKLDRTSQSNTSWPRIAPIEGICTFQFVSTNWKSSTLIEYVASVLFVSKYTNTSEMEVQFVNVVGSVPVKRVQLLSVSVC